MTVNAVTDSRIYNGTTSSSGAPTFGSLFGTDSASFTQAFLSKDVLGPGMSTLRASGVVNDGNGGRDYSLTFVDASGTITPATLTAASQTRTYDGTTSSSLTPTITSGQLFGTDTASFVQMFDSRNAGSRMLSASGSVSDGNNGGNYAVTFVTASGTINKEALTVTAASQTRTYDGTTSSGLTPTITSGQLFGSDTASFVQMFDSRNAGSRMLSASGSVSDGNGGGNYAVTFVTAAGTITPFVLTASVVANSRVYDAGTDATLASTSLHGVFIGDTVSLSGGTALFSDKNVGTGKTVSVTGLSLAGGDAGNYVLSSSAVTALANITPATLTISAVSDTKVFDGTTNSMGNALAMGLKGDDTVSGLAEHFDSTNAGKRILSFGALSVNDGNGGGNYILDVVNPTASGTITRAPLTIAANDVTGVEGGPQPAFSASFAGFPAGFGPSSLTGTLSFRVTAIPGMSGSFEILPGGLSSSNFMITFVPGTLMLMGAQTVASTVQANGGDEGEPQSVPASQNEVASSLLVKPSNFVLPPVPFEMDDGGSGRPPGWMPLDPVVLSILGLTNGASALETGNLKVPSLDEIGNPIGTLIGFNSTFIETCRARAALCR
ncbi:MAG: hypothetical protein JO310_10170 [Hyphomicrobiales bacterium]|nr:hypothetical protein [Hyphomicrobiales bacterium]